MVNYSIDEIADNMTRKLQEYLEAQYPITNPEIQSKRNKLLSQENLLSTKPFIESTPVYEPGNSYDNMNISDLNKEFMNYLSSLKDPHVGVYKKPYEHQEKALTHFLTNNKDIIVSTGTGSGKTESFLHPMLNKLYIEASEKSKGFKERRAVRALILYPMNALVNDQMRRLRLLYGDVRVKNLFKEKGGRPVTFGMYTSRTPYAGEQSAKKDKTHLDPLLDYYMKIEEEDPKLATEMRERGRWIAKDLNKFKKSKIKKNKDTYKTSKDDAELFTRHEMQQYSPDILVTNYSMLEYMLMRPIERNIWDETKAWLAEDKENEFMLVIDEAHMYRGTSGAEVALLIRRLQQRLGIARDRMRCILTSATLGTEGNEESAIQFAEKLTGKLNKRFFQLIEGVKETRQKPGVLNSDELELLSRLNIDEFHNRLDNYQKFHNNNKEIFGSLNWSPLPKDLNELEEYLYEQLDGYPPLEMIISLVSGNARTLEAIAEAISSEGASEKSVLAISNLVILANAAKRNDRVLLPARVHLFFRGITGIYLCLNSKCTDNITEKLDFGRIYDIPKDQCVCGSRTFELLTHLHCGSAFIRLFINNNPLYPKYTWNEKGKGIVDEELTEVHLYVDGNPRDSYIEKGDIKAVWLDLKTGYLFDEPQQNDLLKVYISNKEHSQRKKHLNRDDLITFEECPSCMKDSKGNIRDLKTKGEPPFANLVREQFTSQPPVQGKETQQNQGRKVLIFSDGRQKAARLARDIPREGEKDVLRQMIILIANELEELSVSNYYPYLLLILKLKDVKLLEGRDKLDLDDNKEDFYQKFLEEYYEDFKSFEEIDKKELREIINVFRDEGLNWSFGKGLETVFYQALISPGYSLYDLTVGYLGPNKRILKRLHKGLEDLISEEELYSLSVLFIKSMQENLAFDPNLDSNQRTDIMSQYRSEWGSVKNYLYPNTKKILEFYNKNDKNKILDRMYQFLCKPSEGRYYINPSILTIVNGIDREWYKCKQCRSWHPVVVRDICPTCSSDDIKKYSYDSKVLVSEKGYWRKPILDVLAGHDIFHFTVEEHSAQLSQKDVGQALATTEKYELGFQDVQVKGQEIVDILSCTTTMEVGIDIGSLTAVAMRNIPPFRENYQQRAGRAGRRSTSLSTVITYAQDSPHDHYYFSNAEKMISGDARVVDIYIDNEKILNRHINALLIQSYFHESSTSNDSNLITSLGKTSDFFEGNTEFNIDAFDEWITEHVGNRFQKYSSIFEIIPDEVLQKSESDKWTIMKKSTDYLVPNLKDAYEKIRNELQAYLNMQDESDEPMDIPYYQNQDLLTFLFNHEFLPTYAFPRDLSSLYIEKIIKNKVNVAQRPQLELNQALSQYAPGKTVVVDKETYRVGGIYSPYSKSGGNDVKDLFNANEFVSFCSACHFTQLQSKLKTCPVCEGERKLIKKQYIRPFGFSPEKGESLRRNEISQEYSYAGSPQLPIPNKESDFVFKDFNGTIKHNYAIGQELIVLNRGSHKQDGFLMCDDCGFITAKAEDQSKTWHIRPYLTRESNRCYGRLQNIYLGNRFKTDLLLVRMNLSEKIYFEPSSKWIHDALETLGEAFVIAASRILEIDLNELGIGYRMVHDGQEDMYADLYIFDKLSGGAGYSFEAGEKIQDIFDEMENVLKNCSGNCDQSCYKCLRYYENQFKHSRLDRSLALDLLTYLLYGIIRRYDKVHELKMLEKIQRTNDLLNVKSSIIEDSLLVKLDNGPKIKIRSNIINEEGDKTLYFSPYEIVNDLPNVHERIKEYITSSEQQITQV